MRFEDIDTLIKGLQKLKEEQTEPQYAKDLTVEQLKEVICQCIQEMTAYKYIPTYPQPDYPIYPNQPWVTYKGG